MLSSSANRLLRGVAISALAVLTAASCALPLASSVEMDSLGEQEFEKIRKKTPVSTNGRERTYVNCITNAIVAELSAPFTEIEWEVEVFDDEEMNAFALPGGHIGVNNGIFKAATNADQLAAVIGHEIAHVTEEHARKRVNREMTTQMGVMGAAILTGTGELGAQLGGMVTQLGISLPFSRGEESEADTVGQRLMAAAGFDPRQAVPLWQNMQKKGKGGPPALLSTHPSSSKRIEDLIAGLPETLVVYNTARSAGKVPKCQAP